jgi:hypothetical protein
MKTIPFHQLVYEYHKDPESKHLRFGQWFYNRFIKNTNLEKDQIIRLDTLHATVSQDEALKIIRVMYEGYQWEM